MEVLSDSNKEIVVDEISSLPSVGELTVRVLLKEGYDSLEKIKVASVEELGALEHIGEVKALRIKREIDEGDRLVKVKKEVLCPDCNVAIPVSNDSCEECGTSISSLGEDVILPGGDLLDDPLNTLADIEERLMDGEEDEDLWYSKAAILESMGALEKAYECYDRVIELDPLYDWIWNAKASLAMKLGKYEDATRAYKVAVDFRMDPGYMDILGGRALEEKEKAKPKKTKEHSIDVSVIESKMIDARKMIYDMDIVLLEKTRVEELLEKAIKHRNKDEREEALKYAEMTIESVGKLNGLYELIEEIEAIRSDIELDHGDIDRYIERYTELKEEVEQWGPDKDISDLDALKEKMLETREEMDSIDDLDDRFESAKQLLIEVREMNIDISNIKKEMSLAMDAKKEGDTGEAADIVSKVIGSLEDVKVIYSKIQKAKEDILNLKDSDIDLKGYIGELKDARGRANEGKYAEAHELLDGVINGLEGMSIHDDTSADEVDDEADEVKEAGKISVKDVKERLSKIKSLILFARVQGSNTTEATDVVKEVKVLLKTGEMDKVAKAMDDAMDGLTSTLESKFMERVKSLEAILEDSDASAEVENIRGILEGAKSGIDDGDLKKSFSELSKAEAMTEKTKGSKALAKDTMEYMVKLMERAEELDMDMGDTSEIIKFARYEFSQGNHEEALIHAKRAKEQASSKIGEIMPNIIDEAQDELKKAKMEGKTISDPLFFLKEVKSCEKEGDMAGSLKFLKSFYRSMKQLRE